MIVAFLDFKRRYHSYDDDITQYALRKYLYYASVNPFSSLSQSVRYAGGKSGKISMDFIDFI